MCLTSPGSISPKVRSVANLAMEREERTLSLIERDVGEREARVASREKMLAEREAKVGGWDGHLSNT